MCDYQRSRIRGFLFFLFLKYKPGHIWISLLRAGILIFGGHWPKSGEKQRENRLLEFLLGCPFLERVVGFSLQRYDLEPLIYPFLGIKKKSCRLRQLFKVIGFLFYSKIILSLSPSGFRNKMLERLLKSMASTSDTSLISLLLISNRTNPSSMP